MRPLRAVDLLALCERERAPFVALTDFDVVRLCVFRLGVTGAASPLVLAALAGFDRERLLPFRLGVTLTDFAVERPRVFRLGVKWAPSCPFPALAGFDRERLLPFLLGVTAAASSPIRASACSWRLCLIAITLVCFYKEKIREKGNFKRYVITKFTDLLTLVLSTMISLLVASESIALNEKKQDSIKLAYK